MFSHCLCVFHCLLQSVAMMTFRMGRLRSKSQNPLPSRFFQSFKERWSRCYRLPMRNLVGHVNMIQVWVFPRGQPPPHKLFRSALQGPNILQVWNHRRLHQSRPWENRSNPRCTNLWLTIHWCCRTGCYDPNSNSEFSVPNCKFVKEKFTLNNICWASSIVVCKYGYPASFQTGQVECQAHEAMFLLRSNRSVARNSPQTSRLLQASMISLHALQQMKYIVLTYFPSVSSHLFQLLLTELHTNAVSWF